MSDRMPPWSDVDVRAAFPALAICDDGLPRVYADAPGGTQVAARAIGRMREALIDYCANEGGVFRTSRLTDAAVSRSHQYGAALLGADADEVVYGLSTTHLLFQFSRMLSRDWNEGDEIVLSRMDHEANVSPWLIAAGERGVTVRWLDFDPATFRYRYEALDTLIGPRTRLVACNHASNFLGTVNDVKRIVDAGRAVGAVTVVDAVQSASHMAIDVKAIGCDLLATSPYKYFGPHAGLLYVRREVAYRLEPLKVRPCSTEMPHRHEQGTGSFEAQLGTVGAIEHLAWIGERFGGAAPDASLRARILAGYAAASAHEVGLSLRFLDGIRGMPSIQLYGITDPAAVRERVPTFSLRVGDIPSVEVAEFLSKHNAFVWDGSFYAYEVAGTLGVRETGGVVRVGFAHYNTTAEVDVILDVLRELAARR